MNENVKSFIDALPNGVAIFIFKDRDGEVFTASSEMGDDKFSSKRMSSHTLKDLYRHIRNGVVKKYFEK